MKLFSRRVSANALIALALLAFLFVLVGYSFVVQPTPPVPPPTPTPTPAPPTPVVDHSLKPDKGYYGVLKLEGNGMSIVPTFFVPSPFQIKWRCDPVYGPHWLRIPIYQVLAQVHSSADVTNGTCGVPDHWTTHWKTYTSGLYSISILSHVSQHWEMLIQVKTLDVA